MTGVSGSLEVLGPRQLDITRPCPRLFNSTYLWLCANNPRVTMGRPNKRQRAACGSSSRARRACRRLAAAAASLSLLPRVWRLLLCNSGFLRPSMGLVMTRPRGTSLAFREFWLQTVLTVPAAVAWAGRKGGCCKCGQSEGKETKTSPNVSTENDKTCQ